MSLLDTLRQDPAIRPGRKLEGRVAGCLLADGEGFRTRPVEVLALGLEGIAADVHRGFTRPSSSREPWYPRGTEIRSGRQLSMVSVEEMREVAVRLSLVRLDPGLIGANLVIEGVPLFSFLPAGTRLIFKGGASIVIEGMNHPCRHAGRAIAAEHPGRDDLELGFVAAASRRRGVMASVERAGAVTVGESVSVRIPEQWIWEG